MRKHIKTVTWHAANHTALCFATLQAAFDNIWRSSASSALLIPFCYRTWWNNPYCGRAIKQSAK